MVLLRESSPAAVSAETAKTLIVELVIGKQDGIHHRVRALCRGDGRLQAQFAALIHAIRQDNQRLAALLLAHQLVRRKKDGIIEQGACCRTMPAPSAVATPSSRPGTRRTGYRSLLGR